jgi:large subunit ribosomal protein L25
MMAETILAAEKREEKGKANVRRLRRTGKVPAIIYGEVEESLAVSIDAHTFEMMMKESHSIINLNLQGKDQQVIVREIQYHPVRGNVLHVDFMGVKKGQKITLAVDIHYVGKTVGEQEGGIFSTVKQEINISVLPKDVPDFIEVDISGLEIGGALRVKDVQLENVEFLDDLEDVICRVELPKIQEEVVEADIEEEEEEAEPEVITAREKTEEEEKKE